MPVEEFPIDTSGMPWWTTDEAGSTLGGTTGSYIITTKNPSTGAHYPAKRTLTGLEVGHTYVVRMWGTLYGGAYLDDWLDLRIQGQSTDGGVSAVPYGTTALVEREFVATSTTHVLRIYQRTSAYTSVGWSNYAPYLAEVNNSNPSVVLTPHSDMFTSETIPWEWTFTDPGFGEVTGATLVITPPDKSVIWWTGTVPSGPLTIPANTLLPGTYLATLSVGTDMDTSATDSQLFTIAFENHPPELQINTIPNFTPGGALTVNYTFTDEDPDDVQSKKRGRIYSADNSTLIYDTGELTDSVNSFTVPGGTLLPATTYQAHITALDTRYTENVGTPGRYVPVPETSIIFEVDQPGWTLVSGDGTINTAYTTRYYSAPHSLRIGAGTNGSPTTYKKTMTGLTPGTPHTLSFYWSGISGGPSTTTLTAAIPDLGVSTTRGTTDAGVWRTASLTFTPTAASHDLHLTTAFSGTSYNIGMAYDWSNIKRLAYTRWDAPVLDPTPIWSTNSRAFNTNFPPNAPVLFHKADFISTLPTTFSWEFQDTNGDDNQDAYQLLIQTADGATTVHDTGKVISGTESYVLPGEILSPSTQYRWTVYTWDMFNEQSPAASWDSFYTASAADVTILTPEDGAVLDVNGLDINWDFTAEGTATQQTYNIRVVNEENEVALISTGNVSSSAETYWLSGFASGVPYRIEVSAVASSGVQTPVRTVSFISYYIHPMQPEVTVTPGQMFNLIEVVNPTPSGSRPATAYNEIYRSKDENEVYTLIGTIETNTSFEDYFIAAEAAYTYYVRAVGV